MNEGFLRVASCCPSVKVADVPGNIESIKSCLDAAAARGAAIAVFPEMCVTAYTCGDLFHNRTLLEGARHGLETLLETWRPEWPMAFIGMPVALDDKLYNCAVAIHAGRVAGITPKTYLPDYNEFYEKRWFSAAGPDTDGRSVSINGREVPFGSDIIYIKNDVEISVEICEDLWAPVPPSCRASLAGALVTFNLSASDDIVGKYGYLRSLILQQSARCISGYVYASAGYGESSTDLVFRGKTFVAENGRMLAGGYASPGSVIVADLDIEALRRDRMHLRTFGDCADHTSATLGIRRIDLGDSAVTFTEGDLLREVDPRPFVPADSDRLAERCEEILSIQSAGLAKRLDVTRCKTLVIGVSGGLDSTLALLVAVRAFDFLGLDRRGIIGITMPGFGTTDRTHDNAVNLMDDLGVTRREINIGKAVMQHFSDIGQDPDVHDVTYENSQARERTQILMDVANKEGGMVLGTGDLSELALGWATYNGDHMSMYGVNSGVPKTLVKHLVRYFAMTADNENVKNTLLDIIDTPISPELIPADAQGNIVQKTEDLVGPYELHDFFLYYTLRYGFSPRRIYLLAGKAFGGSYDSETIKNWLKTFFRRFFAQQFKRSCLPDGPKAGSVTLSPRGDWRMPSDASAAMWLDECEKL